ncbi:hypothetical protein DL95DRAFT_418575 [Leptodontidium sp. 2 PMI_412]|nr:hypothetical protein DL95DRAFT_418575 [Leptodontidium sp. 2 PMI_412]
MDMYHSERQIGDDEDSLTEMNEAVQAESFSHDDVRYSKNFLGFEISSAENAARHRRKRLKSHFLVSRGSFADSSLLLVILTRFSYSTTSVSGQSLVSYFGLQSIIRGAIFGSVVPSEHTRIRVIIDTSVDTKAAYVLEHYSSCATLGKERFMARGTVASADYYRHTLQRN